MILSPRSAFENHLKVKREYPSPTVTNHHDQLHSASTLSSDNKNITVNTSATGRTSPSQKEGHFMDCENSEDEEVAMHCAQWSFIDSSDDEEEESECFGRKSDDKLIDFISREKAAAAFPSDIRRPSPMRLGTPHTNLGSRSIPLNVDSSSDEERDDSRDSSLQVDSSSSHDMEIDCDDRSKVSEKSESAMSSSDDDGTSVTNTELDAAESTSESTRSGRSSSRSQTVRLCIEMGHLNALELDHTHGEPLNCEYNFKCGSKRRPSAISTSLDNLYKECTSMISCYNPSSAESYNNEDVNDGKSHSKQVNSSKELSEVIGLVVETRLHFRKRRRLTRSPNVDVVSPYGSIIHDEKEDVATQELTEDFALCKKTECAPVPLLTPPSSPVTTHFCDSTCSTVAHYYNDSGATAICEWPCNLTVDTVITSAISLCPLSPESLPQEAEEEQRILFLSPMGVC
eukprot:scaffold72890_cov52-Attheya_sp.AAC.7